MPFNTLKAILSGKAKLEDVKGKEYIMVKLISFGDVEKADKINRYLWKIDTEIVDGLIYLEASELKRFPRWLKKDKRKNDLIDELLVKYFRMFGLESKELENNYDIVRKIVENNLKQFLKEIGASEQEYKKLGVELEKKKPKTGLERWFD